MQVTWENKDQKHDGDVSFSSAQVTRVSSGNQVMMLPSLDLCLTSMISLQARLKSLKSETEAFIIFNNTSNKKVRALWLDFKGHEVSPAAGGGTHHRLVCHVSISRCR